jgi:hypothetical protein
VEVVRALRRREVVVAFGVVQRACAAGQSG